MISMAFPSVCPRYTTGKHLSANRLRVLLRLWKLGYRYRRPKCELTHLQDAEAFAYLALVKAQTFV